MIISFELAKNPKGTAQEKGTSVQGGKVHHYEKPEITKMRQIYRNAILSEMERQGLTAPHWEGPIYLSVIFTYSVNVKARWGQFKVTKPDLDNSVKLLQDVLSDLGFFAVGDQQVSHLELRKLWGEKPTVWIEIQPTMMYQTWTEGDKE